MTTIVAIHCSASSARQWARLAAALGPAHTLLAPDLIGYGADALPRAGATVTLDAEAARVESIVDALRGPVCLVGHSYGGAVAMRVALHRADRVAGLVLYEPSLFSVITRGASVSREGRDIVATGLGVRDDVRSGRVVPAAARFIDYWGGDGAWAVMDARRREAVCARMSKVAQEFDALFDDAVPLAAYARLPMPVLLLEGETTRPPPRAVARRLLTTLPDVRLVHVAGAGHMGPITHPESVNGEIVRFVGAIGHRERRALAA